MDTYVITLKSVVDSTFLIEASYKTLKIFIQNNYNVYNNGLQNKLVFVNCIIQVFSNYHIRYITNIYDMQRLISRNTEKY